MRKMQIFDTCEKVNLNDSASVKILPFIMGKYLKLN